MAPPKHITSPQDLVTSQAATKAGFLEQAIVKSKEAAQLITEARRFRRALDKIEKIHDLLELEEFREHLSAAAGFSEKALNHVGGKDLANSTLTVLSKVLESEKREWRDAIAYRYLLTKGDTLGGMMRNLTGARAQAKLSGALVRALESRKHKVGIDRVGEQEKIQRIIWPNRRLIFDKKPRLIDKSVDIILLKDASGDSETTLLSEKNHYLACGELKGGIDPAGADEHWKTATAAFERIRSSLRPRQVPLFFIGAAIEPEMAQEIYENLARGHLAYAANLTSEEQVERLADWLVSL